VSIAIANGFELEDVLDVVSAARGLSAPETREQVSWLRRNAGPLLMPTT
jgi:hypothetical protein